MGNLIAQDRALQFDRHSSCYAHARARAGATQSGTFSEQLPRFVDHLTPDGRLITMIVTQPVLQKKICMLDGFSVSKTSLVKRFPIPHYRHPSEHPGTREN
jgi:hypothetical protein